MLAVKNTIPTIRRRDLECNTEILISEIRPQSKRKILIVVLYRPPNAEFAYIRDFKKSISLAMKAKIDQIIICGDFNFPHIDWTTGVATVGDASHNSFTKLVKDN